jgi:membrane protein DedA with SNARE-associated domain
MDITLVILSGTVGSLFGAYCNYFAARLLGRPLLLKYGHYVLIHEQRFIQVEQFFQQHGEISTFIGRLLPVIRHLISLPAGLAKMNHLVFSFYTLLGSLIWVSILTALGYFLGAEQDLIQHYAHQLVLGLIVFSLLLVSIYIYWHNRKQK